MLNIYCGKTLFEGYSHLLKRLKENRKTELFSSHIFVVPDRFSMACEKDIFEYLGIESTFDIKVLTLSRFASMLLGEAAVLSKASSSMIVQKILIDNKKSLKCFYKTKLTSGFANELFATINQLKSCEIKPEDIKLVGEDFFAQKMQDIKFVYEKYQEYLAANSLIDSADKVSLFAKKLSHSDILKGACIYISHFDSFTRQGYMVIKKFLEGAKQVNISTTKNEIGENSHIYLNDVYTNVVALAAELEILPEVFECKGKLPKYFEHIKNNLYAYKPSNMILKENDISLSSHDSFLSECEFVATAIKNKVNNGLRYKNIAVAIPSLESNFATLKKVFEEFEINAFFDISQGLTGTIIDKFIENIISLKTKFFKQEDIIKFIKSPILNLEETYCNDLENYIHTKNIDGKSFFREAELLNTLREKARVYIDFVMALEVSHSYEYFSKAFIKLFEDIELQNKLDNIAKSYFEKGYIEESKKVEQYYEKVIALFESLANIFGDSQCSIFELLDVIKSGFDATSISVTPVSVDGVFVGDCSKSIFERFDSLFVMGAKEGAFPIVSSDCGLITDKEIDLLTASYKLEPSIKTINQRERFKAFNLVLTPTKSLHISYSKGGDEKAMASCVVRDIKLMFSIMTGKGKEQIEELNDDYNYFDFCQKLGAKPHAEKVLTAFLRNIEDGVRYSNEDKIASLLEVLQKDNPYLRNYKTYANLKKQTTIKTNIFFSKGTLSVSEIERYYSCPFKHFVDYGLKLKEQRVDSFDNMRVGNFLHKVAELFVKENLQNLPLQTDLKDVVSDVCKRTFALEEFADFKDNVDNILSIISIQKEALRMCEAINYQLQNSDFRPILTEARFDSGSKIKGLDIVVEDKLLRIVGAIDRVDAFKDYFRIIDYKTGNSETSLKELYFGKKLQLYVYQYVASNSLNLKPSGAYYFPVKNNFSDKDSSGYESYKLKGYTDSSDSVLCATDKNLNDKGFSDIINVSKKKDGGYTAASDIMTTEELLALAEYAMESLKNATREIMQGNIKASPLGLEENGACKYCPYKSICRFDESLGDRARSLGGKVGINTIRGSLDGD